MASTVLQVCLLVVFTLSQCVVATVREYTLDQYCGRTLHVGILTSSFKLKLTWSSYYDPNMDCGVYISTFDFFDQERFYVQFLDFDVDCSDQIQLYDGKSDTASELGTQSCGTGNPSTFATTRDDLYIKFTSDGFTQAKGFTLFINTFHTGICKSYEYSCTNGRCIDNDLYCNDYDNCGDNSDYCYRDYNWWIWMLVGIAVFIIICVVITVICCCCCKKRTPGTVIKPGNQPVVHYQSGTQQAQVNPWYGTPTQPTQPQPMGVQGTYPPGPAPYQPAVMPPAPAYTNASGAAVYPPPQSATPGWNATPPAPPPYSEKM